MPKGEVGALNLLMKDILLHSKRVINQLMVKRSKLQLDLLLQKVEVENQDKK